MVGASGLAHGYQTVDGDCVQDWEDLSHRKLVKGHEESEEHQDTEMEEIGEKEGMEEANHDDFYMYNIN